MNYFRISKFFLYLVPFSVIIVSTGTLFPFIVGKYVFFRTAVGLALIFYLFGLLFQFKDIRSPKINNQYLGDRMSQILKSPLVIAVTIFVVIFLLADFFGYNPSASFWSNFERGEGGLQILSLFVFFILLVLLFKEQEDWYRLFKISLAAGAIVIFYGVLAALDIRGFIGDNLCARFSGSLGNSAYTGTYLIFTCFYAAYLAIASGKKKTKIFLSILIILFFIFLFLTQTRGAFLGLGMSIIAGLGYLFFKLPAGRLRVASLILILVLIISGSLVSTFRNSINLIPFCPADAGTSGTQIFNITVSAESFQTRLALWKQSINIFKERPLLGWGPENFSPAFEKHYEPFFEVWYDRAHNIFFDYLVFSGILGLLSFIGIFAAFYWLFFKARKYADLTQNNAERKNAEQRGNKGESMINGQWSNIAQRALLFALPIAYLIQGLVLFDVLPIYINLFLFLAFSSWIFHKQTLNSKP